MIIITLLFKVVDANTAPFNNLFLFLKESFYLLIDAVLQLVP